MYLFNLESMHIWYVYTHSVYVAPQGNLRNLSTLKKKTCIYTIIYIHMLDYIYIYIYDIILNIDIYIYT